MKNSRLYISAGKWAGVIFLFTKPALGQQEFTTLPAATDSLYGYTAEHPLQLKNGNQRKSIANSYSFLSGLRTQDDQTLLLFLRSTTRNPNYREPAIKINDRTTGLPIGGKLGLLDKYVFLTATTKDTLTLYVDIYNKEKLFIPIGLKYRPRE